MKHLLLTTIAAVVLVECGESASDISIHEAVIKGNVGAVKQHLAACAGCVDLRGLLLYPQPT
jgi:hypothetical protein